MEHILPSELDESLDEGLTLPWDAKMGDDAVRECAEAEAIGYFREVRGDEKVNEERGSDKEESSSSTPTATGRAFLRWLQSKGALVDGETEGTPVTWPPPEVDDDAENEGDAEEASPPAEEEAAAESPEAAGGDGEEGGDAGEAAADEEGGDAGEAAADEGPSPPSLTTLQALTAFYRAIGPVAAAAEEEAAREDAEQARYDAEEAAAEDAEAAGEEAAAAEEETKDTKDEEERARLDAEATRLARAVDCEATFPEFFEALGRCADAAVSTEGASLGEKLATFFAKLEEKVDDEKDA